MDGKSVAKRSCQEVQGISSKAEKQCTDGPFSDHNKHYSRSLMLQLPQFDKIID